MLVVGVVMVVIRELTDKMSDWGEKCTIGHFKSKIGDWGFKIGD